MRSVVDRALRGFVVLSLLSGSAAWADSIALPVAVQSATPAPLAQLGSGSYRKFGFRIYNASLWTAASKWDPAQPYALRIQYTHGLSKDTVVGGVADDIREEGVADDATMARWEKKLNEVLPAVEDGDVLIGLSLPGKGSLLFYNGKQIAAIEDQAFSKAFFDIWLGAKADEDLRAQLLGGQS